MENAELIRVHLEKLTDAARAEVFEECECETLTQAADVLAGWVDAEGLEAIDWLYELETRSDT